MKLTRILSILLLSANLLALAGCGREDPVNTDLRPLTSDSTGTAPSSDPTAQTPQTSDQPGTGDDPQTTGPLGSDSQTTNPQTTCPPAPDTTPPAISGTNFEITQGESVSYRKQVTVTDDTDANPTLEIDNSAVDLDTPGAYPVVYTATDSSGNKSTLTLMLTVKKREYTGVKDANEEYVLYLANEILDEITDDSMSKLQVAYTIWRWTRSHIAYVDTSDKTSWIVGAYDGFKARKGDCFTYFSVSKALLTAAGIDHVDVERDRPSEKSARHYWLLVNVGDGWYHFDSTVYYAKAKPYLFMLTDAELKAWDQKYYKTEHNHIKDGLPEVSTESIQYKVDYNSSKLKED